MPVQAAALPAIPALTLPKTAALSTCCTRSPGFSDSLPLFVADLREQRGSVTCCQVRWLITGGVQTLADKSLQGLSSARSCLKELVWVT